MRILCTFGRFAVPVNPGKWSSAVLFIIVARLLKRRIERKIEDAFGEDQFGSRRTKGTRDAIGMLRIMTE